MKTRWGRYRFVTCLLALVWLAGCGGRSGCSLPGTGPSLVIVSGSENELLESIIKRFARSKGAQVDMQYKGSVDIMLDLANGIAMNADAVWPANSLWLTLGDSRKVIKHEESIMHSPVVFGVKRSVAGKLGWLDRPVAIADILEAAEAGQLRFCMTSASQSNSGASAYLGFIHAMAGSPVVLTLDHLNDPGVQDKVRRLLKRVNRSSGSSGWLNEMMLEEYDQFDAMVNYESMIIEANQALEKRGREPMVAIYPVDGLMIADSPLAYVNKGDDKKETFFKELQAYLLSEGVQKEILDLGRRTGLVGFDTKDVDLRVFNPQWGIDISRIISPIPTPTSETILEALHLYQGGGLRKPSLTAYVLDFSGSMKGNGDHALKQAISLLLDPAQSRRYLLQPSSRDVHIVIPFDSQPRGIKRLGGNNPQELNELNQYIQHLDANGGTDIYAGISSAYEEMMKVPDFEEYFPAVILMTDGKSDGQLNSVQQVIPRLPGGAPIPVFCIAFGDAEEGQLKSIARLTGGRVFCGHEDMTAAFRNAKGYN